MPIAFRTYCATCRQQAPNVLEDGYVGRPSASTVRPRHGSLLNFGTIYSALAGVSLVTEELDEYLHFLRTHRGHRLQVLGDGKVDRHSSVGQEWSSSEEPAAAPAPAYATNHFRVECEPCGHALVSRVSYRIRTLPSPVTLVKPATDAFLADVRDQIGNSILWGGVPFTEDDLEDLGAFLERHGDHGPWLSTVGEVGFKALRAGGDSAPAAEVPGARGDCETLDARPLPGLARAENPQGDVVRLQAAHAPFGAVCELRGSRSGAAAQRVFDGLRGQDLDDNAFMDRFNRALDSIVDGVVLPASQTASVHEAVAVIHRTIGWRSSDGDLDVTALDLEECAAGLKARGLPGLDWSRGSPLLGRRLGDDPCHTYVTPAELGAIASAGELDTPSTNRLLSSLSRWSREASGYGDHGLFLVASRVGQGAPGVEEQ